MGTLQMAALCPIIKAQRARLDPVKDGCTARLCMHVWMRTPAPSPAIQNTSGGLVGSLVKKDTRASSGLLVRT